MTDPRIPGFHVPQHWGRRPRRNTKTLTLEEILVLRRKLTGMTHEEIGRELERDGNWVNNRVQTARKRWGADSVASFLAMPELLDAVREGTW